MFSQSWNIVQGTVLLIRAFNRWLFFNYMLSKFSLSSFVYSRYLSYAVLRFLGFAFVFTPSAPTHKGPGNMLKLA